MDCKYLKTRKLNHNDGNESINTVVIILKVTDLKNAVFAKEWFVIYVLNMKKLTQERIKTMYLWLEEKVLINPPKENNPISRPKHVGVIE